MLVIHLENIGIILSLGMFCNQMEPCSAMSEGGWLMVDWLWCNEVGRWSGHKLRQEVQYRHRVLGMLVQLLATVCTSLVVETTRVVFAMPPLLLYPPSAPVHVLSFARIGLDWIGFL
jgi:hypothetical protein